MKSLNVEQIYYFIPHGTVNGGDYDDGVMEGNKLKIAQAIHDALPEPVSVEELEKVITAEVQKWPLGVRIYIEAIRCIAQVVQPYTSAGAVARIKELEERCAELRKEYGV